MSLSEEISASEDGMSCEENVPINEKESEKKIVKRKRMSEGQRKHLVDYMKSHSIFAKTGLCPGNQGKEGAKRMWKNLAESLNAIGPATRSHAAWKQAWHDLKKRIKQKAGILRRGKRETGGKAPRDEKGRIVTPLTDEEKVIFSLCGGEDWVGKDEDEEIGLPQPTKKSKMSQGCRLENNCSAPLQPQEVAETNGPESWQPLDVGNLSFAYMEDPLVQGTFIPISDILQCDLADTETQSGTRDKSAAAQARSAKRDITDKEGGTRGKSAVPQARSAKRDITDKEGGTQGKSAVPQARSAMRDTTEAKYGTQGMSAAAGTSEKHNESSKGEEHKNKKKSKTIRETYEDTTSKYVKATYELAAAYKGHTAAVKEQTQALKELAQVIPFLSEGVQTVGENLPAAILKLASVFSVYSGYLKSTKNGLKENDKHD